MDDDGRVVWFDSDLNEVERFNVDLENNGYNGLTYFTRENPPAYNQLNNETLKVWLSNLEGHDYNGSSSGVWDQMMFDVDEQTGVTFEPLVRVDVPEPGHILGFITLASFMLGSRKKKE